MSKPSPTFKVTTQPTAEPLTIDELKNRLRVTTCDFDSELQDLLKAARIAVEDQSYRKLITQTVEMHIEDFPGTFGDIAIRLAPVSAITHIKYYDADGTLTTLTPVATYYQTDFASEQRPARIMPAYGQTWPSVRADTYNAVEIQFTAGYGVASSVPQSIKNGMLLLIANWYENREQSIVGTIVSELPWGVEACITPEDWGPYS
jgi:uncharacterized phiE125 gp8 family phage protein